MTATRAQGWLLVPAVATTGELAAAAAGGQALTAHPALLAYTEDLCGIGYRLDLPLRPTDVATPPGRLVGGDSRTRDPAREYYHEPHGCILADDKHGLVNPTDGYNVRADVRQCQGLLAVYALEDVAEGEGFAVVSCSHLGEVEPPAVLSSGRDLPAPLSVVTQPAMRAGDLLLLAEATMHGLLAGSVGEKQLVCGFISRTAPSSFGSVAEAAARGQHPGQPVPAWMDELSPTARAMLAPELEPAATNQIVMSDGGERVWLAEPGTAAESHPGVMQAGTAAEEEVYYFDLHGWLVLRNVMTPEWLAAVQTAISPHIRQHAPQAGEPQQLSMTEHPAMTGCPRPSFDGGDLFQLPDGAAAENFRRCIDHPAVVARLNWMMGGGSVTQSSGGLLMMQKGSAGQIVHSGVTNPTAAGHSCNAPHKLTRCVRTAAASVSSVRKLCSNLVVFPDAFRNGRVMAGASLNVAWQFANSPAGDNDALPAAPAVMLCLLQCSMHL